MAAVVGVLALYTWLFTPLATWWGLPLPADVAAAVGFTPDHVFADDGLVDSNIEIRFAERFDTTGEDLLALYAVVLLAFLSTYFLPLRLKQQALAFWTVVALALLYGVPGTAGLLLLHVVAWLVFHPTSRVGPALLPGLLAWLAFVPRDGSAGSWALVALLPLGGVAVYRFVLLPLLRHDRPALVLRTVVAQSALLTICVGGIVEGLTGQQFLLTLGTLLFFWQWCRMILYHVDFKDGAVPGDLSLGRYLAVFFSPGVVPSWDWGVELGLGYAYTQNSFLAKERNAIVLDGVKILLLALGYLVLGDWLRHGIAAGCEALGVDVYDTWIVAMVDDYMRGAKPSSASVLLTTLTDTMRWTIWFVGIVHFKVGLWRICGYAFDPYFNRPWTATNLVSFWTRFVYHYREFLLRAFYYPVFFRLRGWNRTVRIVVATVAAAGVGNMIWGHLTEEMYREGMVFSAFGRIAQTWPYYVLLSGGIALTELYLLKFKRRRRPWTPGPRLITDVLAAYATMQYFSLIHIFMRPEGDSTVWDHFMLFLRAFGLDT